MSTRVLLEQKNMTTPLPCPACGAYVTISKNQDFQIGFHQMRIECQCGVAGPWSEEFCFNEADAETESIERWNAMPRNRADAEKP